MRVLFVGDVHGEFKLLNMLYQSVKEISPIDIIIQCGDFGIWNDVHYNYDTQWVDIGKESRYNVELREIDTPIYFVGGNHENWDVLHKLDGRSYLKSLIPDAEVYYMSLGSTLQVETHTFGFFGGADSMDKQIRLNNMAMHPERPPIWWESESINADELKYAVDCIIHREQPADIIISHERPYKYTKFLMEQELGYLCHPAAYPSTTALDYIVEKAEALHTKAWWHGHWHERINKNTFNGFEITGLDMLDIYMGVGSAVSNFKNNIKPTVTSSVFDTIISGSCFELCEM